MYISLNWLKKYTDIPEKLTKEELDDRLTLHTVEIEGTEQLDECLDKVVIGRIESVEKHPDADKLSVCMVDVKTEKLQIVCGGNNLKEGMLVPISLLGARVFWHGEDELFEIKKSKIRGVESFGMICASEELKLENIFPHEQGAILDLSGFEISVGDNLRDALELNDVVFEVDNKSMTHRPDLWGHYGLARDVAAFLKVDFNEENLGEIETTNEKTLKATVDPKEACNRYMLLEVDGIEVKESPLWLKKALASVGQRPISNIVDLTNYIMRDLAQPMHAFDADLANTDEIIVRFSEKGETLKTLDGKVRKLEENMVLITKPSEVLMLAGVMGGESTEVNENTTRILLESASFDPTITRKTGTKLGLRTEACIMYEKTLDPENCEHALKKFVKLLKEMCPNAKVVSNVVDIYNKKYSEAPIDFSLEFLNRRAGKEFTKEEVVDTLERLGFKLEGDENNWKVHVPHWRATKDISIADDLVEEVCRIHGYDNIEAVLPSFPMLPAPYDKRRVLKRNTQNLLLGLGYHQILNYAFVGERELELLGEPEANYAYLQNALHSDKYLRRSLVPGLVKSISTNQSHQDSLQFFEIGRIFTPEQNGEFLDNTKNEHLPKQDLFVGAAFFDKENETPFYQIKNTAAQYLNSLGLKWSLSYEKTDKPYLHPLRYAGVEVEGKNVGYIAELNPLIAKEWDINGRVSLLELNFEELVELHTGVSKFVEPSKFPAVKIDLAIVVDRETQWHSIERVVKGNSEFIQDAHVFDIYEGEHLEKGKKSIAFKLAFQSHEKTLTMEEVETEKQNILNALGEKLNASIRK